MLAAGNDPQHRTVCEFRRRHRGDFKQLFVEVVRLAQALGLARIGTLSIDGTTVRANASTRMTMSDGRMQEEERRRLSPVANQAVSVFAVMQDDPPDRRPDRETGVRSPRSQGCFVRPCILVRCDMPGNDPTDGQRHRARIFVDFWNDSLSMREVDKDFRTDWSTLGPVLSRAAVTVINAVAFFDMMVR